MPRLVRDYPRVESILVAEGIQKNGKVGLADTQIIEAKKMAEVIGQKVRKEPTFLIKAFIQPDSIPQTSSVMSQK